MSFANCTQLLSNTPSQRHPARQVRVDMNAAACLAPVDGALVAAQRALHRPRDRRRAASCFKVAAIAELLLHGYLRRRRVRCQLHAAVSLRSAAQLQLRWRLRRRRLGTSHRLLSYIVASVAGVVHQPRNQKHKVAPAAAWQQAVMSNTLRDVLTCACDDHFAGCFPRQARLASCRWDQQLAQ